MEYVIGTVVVYILFKFFSSLSEDSSELTRVPMPEKFETIIHLLNNSFFNGEGKINVLDKRTLNIYKENDNKIVFLDYSTGHLTLTMKYKWFQKETILMVYITLLTPLYILFFILFFPLKVYLSLFLLLILAIKVDKTYPQ